MAAATPAASPISAVVPITRTVPSAAWVTLTLRPAIIRLSRSFAINIRNGTPYGPQYDIAE